MAKGGIEDRHELILGGFGRILKDRVSDACNLFSQGDLHRSSRESRGIDSEARSIGSFARMSNTTTGWWSQWLDLVMEVVRLVKY